MNKYTIYYLIIILFLGGCGEKLEIVDAMPSVNIKTGEASVSDEKDILFVEGEIVNAGDGIVEYGHVLSQTNSSPSIKLISSFEDSTKLQSPINQGKFISQFKVNGPGTYRVRAYAKDKHGRYFDGDKIGIKTIDEIITFEQSIPEIKESVGIVVLNDGYVIGGDSVSTDNKVTLIKTDKHGTVDTEFNASAIFNGSTINSRSLVGLPEGSGFVMVGDHHSSNNIFYVMFDASGVVRKQDIIKIDDYNLQAHKAILSKDGNIVIIGTASTPSVKELFFYKVSPDLSSKFFTDTKGIPDTSAGNQIGYDAIELETGEYMVVGTNRNGNEPTDIILYKTTSRGELLQGFPKIFEKNGLESAFAIERLQNGDYVIGGSSFLDGTSDIYLLVVDDQGIQRDSKVIDYRGGFDVANDLTAYAEDGGLIVAGLTDQNAYLLKLNNDLSKDWDVEFGTSGIDRFKAVVVADEGVVATGFKSSVGYLVKTDDLGKL